MVPTNARLHGLAQNWLAKRVGKWPDYYPDSLPPVVDIGPGSPERLLWIWSKVPEKYQTPSSMIGAMENCAVHLRPDGAAYSALWGHHRLPLPLTDMVINPEDGAMYFAIGGRRTKSALYRVTYEGRESTVPAPLMTGGEDKELFVVILNRSTGDRIHKLFPRPFPTLGTPILLTFARNRSRHQPQHPGKNSFSAKPISVTMTGLLALTAWELTRRACLRRSMPFLGTP